MTLGCQTLVLKMHFMELLLLAITSVSVFTSQILDFFFSPAAFVAHSEVAKIQFLQKG